DDGAPDFSIGQYLSSNGSTYHIYSLLPDGIAVLHRDLYTADHSYSYPYEKSGNTTFKNRYYNMENGSYAEVLYTWQKDRFVRTECEGCGMTAGEPGGSGNGGGSGATNSSGGDETATSVEPAAALERTWSVLRTDDDGFTLIPSDPEGMYVSRTWTSPPIDGVTYAVHIVNTYADAEGSVAIGRDAIVVH